MSDSSNDPLIWYPDPEHCFLLGKVLDRNENAGKIKVRSVDTNLNAGEESTVDLKKCRDWDESHTAPDVCDVSKCSGMSEAPMLDILRRRLSILDDDAESFENILFRKRSSRLGYC